MLNKQTPQNHDSCTTSYNELLKLKQLLNDGVITKEDFETKKNQILGV
ncbi:SHOCT domain-containing protein [Convivina praedatoris]